MCLSPALADSLRRVVDTHVVGNLKDEGLNIYSISVPRANCFLVVPPEDCRSNIVGLDVAHKKTMKHDKWGQGTSFERIT